MRFFGTVRVTLALIVSGCAGIKLPAGQGDGGGTGGGNGSGGAIGGFGGAGGTRFPSSDAAVTHPLDGMIKSDSPDTITVAGKPKPVHLGVVLSDGTMPARINWSVDNVAIGSVGDDGVFTPNGYVGGVVTVTATVGAGTATTTITVNVDITRYCPTYNMPCQVDGSNMLNPQDTTTLMTGGQDPQFKWLYPYDKTVFPRGLTPPTLQFGGNGGTRAAYLTITAPHFKYQQFSNLNDPLQVTMPPEVWKGLTLTAGPKDTVTASVNKLSGNTGSGPLKQGWLIAPASINGVFYYSTYKNSMLTMPAGQGGIMRIPAGQAATVVVSAGGNLPSNLNGGAQCTACHSVSANGSVMSAGSQNQPTPGSMTTTNPNGDWNPVTSQTYNLDTAGKAAIRTQTTNGQLFSFIGLTPDGGMGLVSGLPPKRNWPFLPHGIFSTPGTASKLIDTTTGMDIAAPSLGPLVQYATTPAFSPDGAHVAFINGDKLGAACTDVTCTGACLTSCQRVLSEMDFDGKASPPVFSNVRDLVTDAGPGKAVAWPTFLPDGKGVIYQQGDSLDSSQFVSDGAPLTPQFGELRLVESADKTIKTLNAINGRDDAGMLYLPYGEMVEGRMNYEASVLPVAVGGYYWVLFTSRRAYGNTISPTSGDPAGNDPFAFPANPSARKKIWIAAIDIDHPGKTDPSHPAFYLPGQELHTANMRAFAALAPCKANTMSCETGADCCGGFCRETSRGADGIPVLQCVPPPVNTCSNTFELCKTAADCCSAADQCINSRCSQVIQ
ncbi:MAG TPA: hypothetical protein VNO55_26640 [Polyangia bacterium]|nr:hypothetical protein [Polyangia bacterium]